MNKSEKFLVLGGLATMTALLSVGAGVIGVIEQNTLLTNSALFSGIGAWTAALACAVHYLKIYNKEQEPQIPNELNYQEITSRMEKLRTHKEQTKVTSLPNYLKLG